MFEALRTLRFSATAPSANPNPPRPWSCGVHPLYFGLDGDRFERRLPEGPNPMRIGPHIFS